MAQAMRAARREKGWAFRKIGREWGISPALAYKIAGDVKPAVVAEPEDPEPFTAATGPAPLEPSQPQTPAGSEPPLPQDSLVKVIKALVESEVPPAEIGPFIQRLEDRLNGTPPQMPKVSYEISATRPQIVVNNGPEKPSTGNRPAFRSLEPNGSGLSSHNWERVRYLLTADALKRGFNDPDLYLEEKILPDLAFAASVLEALPGKTDEEKRRQFKRTVEAARRYYKGGEDYLSFLNDGVGDGEKENRDVNQ